MYSSELQHTTRLQSDWTSYKFGFPMLLHPHHSRTSFQTINVNKPIYLRPLHQHDGQIFVNIRLFSTHSHIYHWFWRINKAIKINETFTQPTETWNKVYDLCEENIHGATLHRSGVQISCSSTLSSKNNCWQLQSQNIISFFHCIFVRMNISTKKKITSLPQYLGDIRANLSVNCYLSFIESLLKI